MLLGHSWGGAVAIDAGLRIPVWRVAAVDPMIRQVDEQWYHEYLDELREDFSHQGRARDARVRQQYADWSPVDVEAKVHAVHAMTISPIEALMSENPPEAWDLRHFIANYDKPLWLAMANPAKASTKPRRWKRSRPTMRRRSKSKCFPAATISTAPTSTRWSNTSTTSSAERSIVILSVVEGPL